MNLFIFDLDHQTNAKYHCKKHITKMPLEAAQILCTTINFYGGKTKYKSTHINHPIVKWARTNQSNFLWTYNYGVSLCEEFLVRRKKNHACLDIIKSCGDQISLVPIGPITPFSQAMPEQYRILNDPVQAYRNFFCGAKQHLADWEFRSIPEWYKL